MTLEIQVLAWNGQQKCKLNYTDQQKKCNTILFCIMLIFQTNMKTIFYIIS